MFRNKLPVVKINFLDKTFVFLLIFYAASATNFARSINSWEVIESIAGIVGFTIYYVSTNKIKIKNDFYVLIGVYTLYFILLTLKFSEVHPRFFGIYALSFFITYVVVTKLKQHVFILYENILYHLCWIAIVFWALNQIIPTQLSSIFDQIAFYKPGSDNVRSNIIVYTINNMQLVGEEYTIRLGFITFTRNPGFAWEPGAFAVFIILAIFVHFVKSKFKNVFNKRFWLYSFCLFTTFSTTGFALLAIVLCIYLYNIETKYKTVYFVLLISLGAALFYSDFVSAKLDKVVSQDTNEQIDNSIAYDIVYTPQRYSSFLIDFKDFENNPILGYGGHVQEMWTAKLGAQIGSISGLGKLLARFGLVGTIFFFYMLIKSSKKLCSTFDFKGWLGLFIIMLMISISYSLIEQPLLMCFWLFSLFSPRLIRQQVNKKSNYV